MLPFHVTEVDDGKLPNTLGTTFLGTSTIANGAPLPSMNARPTLRKSKQ
jgi:hypothetical protein